VLVHVTPTDRQTKTNSRGTETLFLALNLRLVQSFCSPRGNVSRHFSVGAILLSVGVAEILHEYVCVNAGGVANGG
jgi:hypothetical protein